MKEHIRFARFDDIDNIMDFLKVHWNENHILATSKSMFEYQHVMGDKVNYIISELENKRITAVLGFIPYSLSDEPDIGFAIIRKDEQVASKIIGAQLLEFAQKSKFGYLVANGINPKIVPIFRFLRYPSVVKLKQFYILNDQVEEYKIAEVSHAIKFDFADDDARLEVSNEISEGSYNNLEQKGYYKDYWYFNHRYVNYPFYEYKCLKVIVKDELELILVTRVTTANDSKAIRIVDYIGNLRSIGRVKKALYDYLVESNSEYMDFYFYGDPKFEKYSGFKLRDEDDSNIIPNYFEPFVRANIEITSATTMSGEFHLCKADSDQDRPNSIQK